MTIFRSRALVIRHAIEDDAGLAVFLGNALATNINKVGRATTVPSRILRTTVYNERHD